MPRKPTVGRPHYLGNEVDRWIGVRVRSRRQTIGMAAGKLAKELDVARQTIDKWEEGVRRMSAGQLGEVAALLGVDPGWFYEGFPGMPSATPRDLDIALRMPEAGTVLMGFAKLDMDLRVTVLELLAALGRGRMATLDGKETPLAPAPGGEVENADEFAEEDEVT